MAVEGQGNDVVVRRLLAVTLLLLTLVPEAFPMQISKVVYRDPTRTNSAPLNIGRSRIEQNVYNQIVQCFCAYTMFQKTR